MAGETVKTEAICLNIYPWSQTSHVVQWLTPTGRVSTVVKGAVRPKSFFLGQYDLNYTCEILYYARGKGDVHALREAMPLNLRETLRNDFRGLSLAGYARQLVGELAPSGGECAAWYRLLSETLDSLSPGDSPPPVAGDSPQVSGDSPQVSGDSPHVLGDSPLNFGDSPPISGDSPRDFGDSPPAVRVRKLVAFELKVLKLAGLLPDFDGYDRFAPWSAFSVETGRYRQEAEARQPADEGRQVRVAREVAEFLANPDGKIENLKIPLDAARVIGVFYQFHLDCAIDVRRTVLRLIS